MAEEGGRETTVTEPCLAPLLCGFCPRQSSRPRILAVLEGSSDSRTDEGPAGKSRVRNQWISHMPTYPGVLAGERPLGRALRGEASSKGPPSPFQKKNNNTKKSN